MCEYGVPSVTASLSAVCHLRSTSVGKDYGKFKNQQFLSLTLCGVPSSVEKTRETPSAPPGGDVPRPVSTLGTLAVGHVVAGDQVIRSRVARISLNNVPECRGRRRWRCWQANEEPGTPRRDRVSDVQQDTLRKGGRVHVTSVTVVAVLYW